jgi:hypothetical protein
VAWTQFGIGNAARDSNEEKREEVMNAERSSNALEIEEFLCSGEGIGARAKKETSAPLSLRGSNLNQDAEVVHEWEGKLLEDCTFFSCR